MTNMTRRDLLELAAGTVVSSVVTTRVSGTELSPDFKSSLYTGGPIEVYTGTQCWNNLDADILAWQIKARDADRVIGELYELRHLIEPMAASLAAKNAKASHINVLRDGYHEMELAGDDGEQIKGPDMRFHQAIIAASGNRLFSSLAHVIGAALAVNFDLVSKAPRGQKHSMPAHRRVLEAIASHDARAVSRARDTRNLRKTAKQFKSA